MSLFAKIRGTIETIFQIGLGGPQLKNNSGTIEARNSADAAFVKVRALEPASGIGSGSDNEVVTQKAAQQDFARSFLLMGG